MSRRASRTMGARALEHQRFAEEQNLREGGPQLVRHARSEIGAQARKLMLASKLQHRRAHQTSH
jgi:hypothetical protein